ncbi:hypothetical protein Tco_1512922 [Tanacetum coccineum]
MVVRAQPTLSPGMSARIEEAVALSPSSFRKSEGNGLGGEDTEEDGENESSDSDVEREVHGLGDEGHGLDDEVHSLEDAGLGSKEEEEEAVPEGQQQAAPAADTAVSEPLGLVYRALRRRELAVEEDQVPSTFEVDPEDDRVYTDIPGYAPPAAPVQTPPSPEWSSGSLHVSPSSVVPSPIASPVATPTATISRLDALPPIVFADIDRDVRELYTRSGAVRDEIFSQRYRLRSLEREQERVARENHDLRMQLAEERHERLELADRVARMERRQE